MTTNTVTSDMTYEQINAIRVAEAAVVKSEILSIEYRCGCYRDITVTGHWGQRRNQIHDAQLRARRVDCPDCRKVL